MANWVVVENNVVTERYDDLPQNWRNISNVNQLPTQELKKFGLFPSVVKTPAPYNMKTHMVRLEPDFVVQIDHVDEVYVVIPRTVLDPVKPQPPVRPPKLHK